MASVATYGGFYIARYEAGLPQNDSLWGKTNGATYGWTNGSVPGSTGGTRNTNIDGMIPVSKKNNASWNRISQENAEKVSKLMYEGNSVVTSVNSRLVDSYAWDTVVEWLKANGTDVTDSRTYGNYVNSTFRETLIDALYAVHNYHWETNNNYWNSYASKYKRGNLTITVRSQSGDVELYELATGTTKLTKTNNIYDLAGNMWEWTTETGYPDGTTTKCAVLRGGSFGVRIDI